MIRRRLARNTPVRGLRFSPEGDRPSLEGKQGSQPVEEAEEGSTEQETVRSAEEWLMDETIKAEGPAEELEKMKAEIIELSLLEVRGLLSALDQLDEFDRAEPTRKILEGLRSAVAMDGIKRDPWSLELLADRDLMEWRSLLLRRVEEFRQSWKEQNPGPFLWPPLSSEEEEAP